MVDIEPVELDRVLQGVSLECLEEFLSVGILRHLILVLLFDLYTELAEEGTTYTDLDYRGDLSFAEYLFDEVTDDRLTECAELLTGT